MEFRSKVVAIVGQTASGKTRLAVELAKKFKGEIICADSRTIYKGMDIGTAKPSASQQEEVPHHCLDIIYPDQQYSVAQFKIDAQNAIDNICSKGKVPFIVGGSGLYIDALLYDFDLEKKDARKLDKDLDLEELQLMSRKLGLNASEQTMQNKQHLMRFIERGGASNRKKLRNTLLIGVELDKETLNKRIAERVDQMVSRGIINETKNLLITYGSQNIALKTSGYGPLVSFINSEISSDETKSGLVKIHKNLAKKQKTWFKRNKDINWVNDIYQAEQLINDYLVQ